MARGDKGLARKGVVATSLREARVGKARALVSKQDETGAMAIYRELMNSEMQSLQGAEATYMVISDHYRKGENSKVEELTYKLADSNTPQLYWVARAYLVLCDMYAESDSFQARATYQSIVDGYPTKDDGIMEEAKAKIAKLK